MKTYVPDALRVALENDAKKEAETAVEPPFLRDTSEAALLRDQNAPA